MGVTTAVTRFALGGAGNQDITTTDIGGLTPVAVLFIGSFGITDGTAAAHNVVSVGAATGASNEWVIGTTDEDSTGGVSDTDRIMRNDSCILFSTPGAQAEDGRANFVQFITNGVRINVSNAPAASYLVTAVLFAGTDLSAQADIFQMDSTQDNTVDVNTVGFEPDALITATSQRNALDAYVNSSPPGLGFVHNDRAAGITQRSTYVMSSNNQNPTAIGSRMTESYGCMSGNGTGGAIVAAEFGTFDANGFSCTTRLFGFGMYVGFLALRFGSGPFVESYVGTYDTPTVTGIDIESGPAFFPQLVLMIGSQIVAVDTQEEDADAGCLCYSSFDGDDEYCVAWNSQDNVAGDSVTQSLSDDQAINLPDDDGSQGIEATFSSFDGNGFRLNYSAVKGTARKFIVLAIEDEACLTTVVNTVVAIQ
jgi:hypothetical protein